jgi:ABC-type enterochelin transport system substrate-binding protein
MFRKIIDIKAKRAKVVLDHIQDGCDNALIEMDKIIKHFGKESMSVMITEQFKLTMLPSERAQRFHDQLIDFGKSALHIQKSFHGQKIN